MRPVQRRRTTKHCREDQNAARSWPGEEVLPRCRGLQRPARRHAGRILSVKLKHLAVGTKTSPTRRTISTVAWQSRGSPFRSNPSGQRPYTIFMSSGSCDREKLKGLLDCCRSRYGHSLSDSPSSAKSVCEPAIQEGRFSGHGAGGCRNPISANVSAASGGRAKTCCRERAELSGFELYRSGF